MLDQAAQRQGLGLAADVPVSGPGELAQTGEAACFDHPGQAEIEAIGQQPRHQNPGISGGFARPQMGEAVREASPAGHFRQQVSDPDAGQRGMAIARINDAAAGTP